VRARRTRISTLGIGNASPVDLARGIAEATGGTHEFIDDPARLEASVIRSPSAALYLVLTDVSIVSDCGTLVNGGARRLSVETLLLLTFFSNVTRLACLVTVSGQMPGSGAHSATYPLGMSGVTISAKIPHSVAVLLGSRRNTFNRQEVIELCHALCLLTDFTSLVLYDNTASFSSVAGGKIAIPVPVPGHEWHPAGMPAMAQGVYSMTAVKSLGGRFAARKPAVAMSIDSMDYAEMEDSAEEWDDNGPPEGKRQWSAASREERTPRPGDDKRGVTKVRELTRPQTAIGSWRDLEEGARVVGVSAEATNWGNEGAATALAAEFMKAEGAVAQVEMLKKAVQWLTAAQGMHGTSYALS